MTTAEPTGAIVTVRRPAVHASTLVRSDIEHTFDVFVRTIGAWWPIERMSGGRERVHAVAFEPRVGGRVYETWDDATTVDWGEIVAWEPPTRFTMTWTSTPVVTEVELNFTALAPNLTRVTVEHRGWEAMTDEQLKEDCAAPGGYGAGAYDTGWQLILDRFKSAIDRETAAQIPDEYMLEMLAKTKEYTFVLLSRGPNYDGADRDSIIWEHGRRNFSLRADGVLAIVCPILDDTPCCGIGILNASVDDTVRIMQHDPAVRAGVLTFELHPVRSFPGDKLPG
jgi:hypothetical protein